MTEAKTKTPAIYKAMGKVMAKVGVLAKTERNKYGAGGGYDYRGIDLLLDHMHPLLADANIVVLPHCLTENPELKAGPVSAKGNQQYTMVLSMSFEFTSTEDGSSVTAGPFIGEGLDGSDKCSNKAQTAAYKWCFFQTFCVPVKNGMTDSETPNAIDEDNANGKKAAPPSRMAADGSVEMPPKPLTPLQQAKVDLLDKVKQMVAEATDTPPKDVPNEAAVSHIKHAALVRKMVIGPKGMTLQQCKDMEAMISEGTFSIEQEVTA